MSIKNHHQTKIGKVFKYPELSALSKTSAVLVMLLLCTKSARTTSSEIVSSENFICESSFQDHLLTETGVPAGAKLRQEIKFYNKYRFEDTELLPKVKEKIDRLDMPFDHSINPSC